MAFTAVSRSNDPQWKTSGGEPPEGELQAEWINPRTHESVRPPEGYGMSTRWFEIGDGEDFCNGDLVRLNASGQLVELTAVTQTVAGVALECAVCPGCDDLTPPPDDPKRPIVIPIITDIDSDLPTDIIYEVPDVNSVVPVDSTHVDLEVALDLTDGDWTIDVSDTSNTDVKIVGSHGSSGKFFVKFLSAVVQTPFSNPDWNIYGFATAGVALEDRTWATLYSAAAADRVVTESVADPGDGFFCCGVIASTTSSRWWGLSRGIITFDLSGIRTEETITGATFVFFVDQIRDTIGSAEIGFVSMSALATDTAISKVDYNNFTAIEYATRIALSSMTVNTSSTATLNSTALNALNTALASNSQIFRMGIRLGWDIDNSEPSWGSLDLADLEIEPDDSTTSGQRSGLQIVTDG